MHGIIFQICLVKSWVSFFRCRVEEFYTILPRQPYRPEDNSGEVRMEFEAVLLDAQRDRANQLWIHAKIKACVIAADCVPVSESQ